MGECRILCYKLGGDEVDLALTLGLDWGRLCYWLMAVVRGTAGV